MAARKLEKMASSLSIMFIFSVFSMAVTATSCSRGQCKLGDECSIDSDCGEGLHCLSSCAFGDHESKCVRSKATDQFKIVNNSLPFNKYAFLMTHNSYAIKNAVTPFGGPRITFVNQEDSITQQLQNGVRGLMLDIYDYRGDVWLCHSFGHTCHDFTAFRPAMETLKEISTFLSKNRGEIVTLIIEDYVLAPNGLMTLLKKTGLNKFLFPLSKMPKSGEDWPTVKDMVVKNHRLLVFTSNETKQETEGIAYQWNYIIENQFGNGILNMKICPNRTESRAMKDRSRSLVLLNHFPTIPLQRMACKHNSEDDLMDMLEACYGASDNRWANFVAVDYYKKSDGGGVFQVIDRLNGRLMCGRDDVHQCVNEEYERPDGT